MKREETDVWFKIDSDDNLIFNPKGESQPKFLFREFKNRLSYLREEIASREKSIDLLLGKGEKKKEILNMIELELFKRQLEIDREKFESIRNWFSQNKINEPGSLEEKFEKQQQKKRIDKYIKMVRQKVTKKMESAKGEKNKEVVNDSIDNNAEHRVAVNIIKKQKRQLGALKLHRHKPTQMEMKEIIDKHRFKSNDKANCTKIGDALDIDPETAKRWIQKLGLSDYAFNPKHLK